MAHESETGRLARLLARADTLTPGQRLTLGREIADAYDEQPENPARADLWRAWQRRLRVGEKDQHAR